MNTVENNLQKLGLTLPPPKPPVGNYLGSKQIGNLLFASARVSELTGEVGTDVTQEEAKQAARNTALNILAIIKEDIKDLDKIIGVIKLQGFVRSASTFTKQPQVIDGASELLIELFGENGRHARTATGTSQLPFGAAVQLDIIFQLK